MKQSTIKRSVSCSGVGLHSGKLVKLALHPAAEDTGIVFDIHGPSGVHRVEPSPQAAVGTGLATTLGVPGATAAVAKFAAQGQVMARMAAASASRTSGARR